MKKKEYEREIRRLKSEQKLVFLSHVFQDYLSEYPEDAMKLIESTFLSEKAKEKGGFAEKYPNLFLDVANYYEMNGEYEAAKDVLFEMLGNGILQKESAYRIKRIELKKSLEQGEEGKKELDDIKSIVGGDYEHEMSTDKQGTFSDYDLMVSYFKKIPVNRIKEGIFPINMRSQGHTQILPGDEPGGNRKYNPELSAIKRFNFMMENFNVQSVSEGTGVFTGTMLFDFKDSDLVIAESFFVKDANGEFIDDYGKATYILPKDSSLDLIKLSRGELRSGKGGKVTPVIHRSEKYYENLVEKYNKALKGDFEKIKVIDEKQSSEKAEVSSLTDKLQKLIDESNELDKKIEEAEKILLQKEAEKIAAEKSYEEAKVKTEELKEKRGEINDRLAKMDDLLH